MDCQCTLEVVYFLYQNSPTEWDTTCHDRAGGVLSCRPTNDSLRVRRLEYYKCKTVLRPYIVRADRDVEGWESEEWAQSLPIVT